MLTEDDKAKEFIGCLVKNNFRFFASVPDSLLCSYFSELDKQGELISHVSALREDIAIGVAAGSVMCGIKSVVLMQNSGLGVCVNAIASLIVPFRIPILLIIGYRGFKGMDTEENLMMGSITESLLMSLKIKVKLLSDGNIFEITDWASQNIDHGNSAAILIQQSKLS